MAIVYGRFTEAELDRQGNDPYIFVGDRRYRITELVHRHTGGANYQAREVTGSEPEPPEPTMPEPTTVVSVGGGVAVEHKPSQKDPPLPEPKPFRPIVPPLNVWAKTHGWAGTGRIPNSVRDAYRREFGAEE